MRFKLILPILCLYFCFSCTSKTPQSNSDVNQINSNISVNSNLNSNRSFNSNLSSNNQTVENPAVNNDMLKQIEEQQRENKRLAEEKMNQGGTIPTNSNTIPTNKPPKSNVPSAQRRTT